MVAVGEAAVEALEVDAGAVGDAGEAAEDAVSSRSPRFELLLFSHCLLLSR